MDFERGAGADDFCDYNFDEYDIDVGYDDVYDAGDGSCGEDETLTEDVVEYYHHEFHLVESEYKGLYGLRFGSWEDEERLEVGIARVPLSLLQSTAALLEAHQSLPRAWMLAIAEKFSDTSLRKLRLECPSLLPRWLLQRFPTYQDVLVLRHGGIFARRLGAHEHCEARSKPLAILAAASKCRFREGFPSEGMLCNNPPIPLRVLDFLEHTEDLVNLALVCKSTHQAGHVLLQREFPGGLGPELVTHDDMVMAVERRKRSMLEGALRQPMTSSTASASMMAVGPEPQASAGAGTEPDACAGAGTEPDAFAGGGTEPEACAGAGTEPQGRAGAGTAPNAFASAGMEPEACVGAGTEPEEPEECASEDEEGADHAYENFYQKISTIVETGQRQWDVVDWCMFTLLYANMSHAAEASVREPPHPALKCLLREGGVADDWRSGLKQGVQAGIVMDTEAVRRAIAQWAEFYFIDSDWSGGQATKDAEHVMWLLHAAERDGQGVIVHPGCLLTL